MAKLPRSWGFRYDSVVYAGIWRKPVLVTPRRDPARLRRGFFICTYCTDNKSGVKACTNTFFPYNYGMENKRMGRPPKPASERATARLEIRMTAAELALIERAAQEKTSTWARDVLVRAAKRAVK
jgi:hypothetical protein